jgi:hypothetical protein
MHRIAPTKGHIGEIVWYPGSVSRREKRRAAAARVLDRGASGGGSKFDWLDQTLGKIKGNPGMRGTFLVPSPPPPWIVPRPGIFNPPNLGGLMPARAVLFHHHHGCFRHASGGRRKYKKKSATLPLTQMHVHSPPLCSPCVPLLTHTPLLLLLYSNFSVSPVSPSATGWKLGNFGGDENLSPTPYKNHHPPKKYPPSSRGGIKKSKGKTVTLPAPHVSSSSGSSGASQTEGSAS